MLAACGLSSIGALAAGQRVIVPMPVQTEIPKAVSEFLKTSVGRKFVAADVMKAYNKTAPQYVGTQGATVTPVLTEGFSLWKAGTEDAPDPTDIAASTTFDDFMTQPGWQAFYAYQAGQKAYLGYDNEGDDGPGYLKTPPVDLRGKEGTFRVKFRVRNANKDVTDQRLQYFVMDDDPNNPSAISAATLPMTNEWSDVELVTDGGRQYTSVMFFGWQGHVLVDSVSVEALEYPLTIPKNVKMEMVGAHQTRVSWDAVENATSYEVTITEGKQYGQTLGTATSTSNEAVVTATITPGEQLYAYVVAKGDKGESYPAFGMYTPSVSTLDAPVAKEATNVSENGFTANWTVVDNALNYKLSIARSHEVTEQTEQLTLLSDNFDSFTAELGDPNSTLADMNNFSLYSLDELIANPGWSTYLGMGGQGMLGITNVYAAQGLPGALFGPESDFSIGQGKATVSGKALTTVDDAVLKIGFGKLSVSSSGAKTITLNEGAKEVEVSTAGTDFDVEVSGGSPGSRLIMQITDAAQGGDVVLFDNLNVGMTLYKGDKYNLPYVCPTLDYDAESYNVAVPFTGNDSFQYNVTAKFGTVSSAASNTITVNSPTYNGIEAALSTRATLRMDGGKLCVGCPEVTVVNIYSANGALLKTLTVKGLQTIELPNGAYIVKAGDSVIKVIK